MKSQNRAKETIPFLNVLADDALIEGHILTLASEVGGQDCRK